MLDLNTLLDEGGEKVPDLNKILAGHEEDQDVVAVDEVWGADHFGLHPDQNDEQAEIHQGKHICLYPKLELAHLSLPLPLPLPLPLSLSPSPSPSLYALVYFSVLKSEATLCYLVIATIFSPETLVYQVFSIVSLS